MRTFITQLFAPLALLALANAGCTALGPMPATTGQSLVPAARPGLELQAGGVPGYFLSQSTQRDPGGATLDQAAGMIEPGDAIGVPGLAIGGRYLGGGDGKGVIEPMLRYRVALDPRVAVGIVAYGTHGSGEDGAASYAMTRGGAEFGYDVRLTPESQWIELHAFSSLALTGLDARGSYCADADGFGKDCAAGEQPTLSGKARGLFPSLTAGLGLDFGRHLDGVFHGARVSVLASGGDVPRVENGEQQGSRADFFSAGLLLTLGGGAAR